ncbi:MAG TPA: hypothetical protein VGK81_12710 [Anaerolineae bacterium]
MQQSGESALGIARLAFVQGDGDPYLTEAVRWTSLWPATKKLPVVHHAYVAIVLNCK